MSKNDLRWPVGIIIVFGLFFLALLVFLLLALKSKDSLVERDYYRKGVDYQMQIDRIDRTKSRNEDIQLSYSNENSRLILVYPGASVTGDILLYRPDDITADRRFAINPDDSIRQSIDLNDLKTGLWRIKINWNTKGGNYYKEEILIIRAGEK